MTYKTGSWGKDAKERSKRRTKYFVDYRRKEPTKKHARHILYYAVKRGIVKPLPCRDCVGDSIKRIEAHHQDYMKPLDVVWLCSTHHREEHKKIKGAVYAS